MASPTASSSSIRSGLTGGAATGLGVDFQTRYAVLLALKLILRLFTECPTHRPLLSIEPRLLPEESATESQLTRWDIQVSPDLLAVEAKANLSKQDILDFLDRCRRGLAPGQNQTFELIYGHCNVGFLHAVEKLLRLSVEAGEDSARFDALCALESDAQLTEVLGQLSTHAFEAAKQIKLKHSPEHQLTDDIDLQLQFLVHPSKRRVLFSELWTMFSQAMESRT